MGNHIGITVARVCSNLGTNLALGKSDKKNDGKMKTPDSITKREATDVILVLQGCLMTSGEQQYHQCLLQG